MVNNWDSNPFNLADHDPGPSRRCRDPTPAPEQITMAAASQKSLAYGQNIRYGALLSSRGSVGGCLSLNPLSLFQSLNVLSQSFCLLHRIIQNISPDKPATPQNTQHEKNNSTPRFSSPFT